ncbi:hypothetical protein GJ496_006334 [Pomphorhynchus laevis]|nr:hypothetical protein GJ496_006334 [Pomphorhynchus laevis]
MRRYIKLPTKGNVLSQVTQYQELVLFIHQTLKSHLNIDVAKSKASKLVLIRRHIEYAFQCLFPSTDNIVVLEFLLRKELLIHGLLAIDLLTILGVIVGNLIVPNKLEEMRTDLIDHDHLIDHLISQLSLGTQ